MILTVIVSSMTIRAANEQRVNVAQNTAEYMLDFLKTEYNAITNIAHIKLTFEEFVESKKEQLSDTLDILSKNAEKMTIMITNENADILVCTDNLYSGSITEDDVVISIQERKGELIYTDMGIMDQKYGVYILPMRYTETDTTAGALIVCFSANDVDELTMKTVRTIILASLWVMIASFVAIYFITERIVSLLRQMSYATKQFAAGKFDVRVPVEDVVPENFSSARAIWALIERLDEE